MSKDQGTKRGQKITGAVETLRHQEAKCPTQQRGMEERNQELLWGPPASCCMCSYFYSCPKYGHLALTMNPDNGAAGGSAHLTFVPPTILYGGASDD